MTNISLTPRSVSLEEQAPEWKHLNDLGSRLRWIRNENGVTQSAFAKLIGVNQSRIPRYENGEHEPTRETLITISNLYHISLEWLVDGIGEPHNKGVPLLGHVGAGAEVWPFDDGPLDYVLPPFGAPPGAVGVIVRGDSMEPEISDGDILIYRRDGEFVADDCLNRKCIVKTGSGRIYVKIVKLSTKSYGFFTLLSTNAPPIEDVVIEWAAPVMGLIYKGSY